MMHVYDAQMLYRDMYMYTCAYIDDIGIYHPNAYYNDDTHALIKKINIIHTALCHILT